MAQPRQPEQPRQSEQSRQTEQGGEAGVRRRRPGRTWQPVCRVEDLEPGRGATALVQGQAVALFRLGEHDVVALGNHDPCDRSSLLAKGIVGVRDEVEFVATTRHGRAFDLRTGRCLDDAGVAVPVFPVRVLDGTVLVGPRRPRVTGREP